MITIKYGNQQFLQFDDIEFLDDEYEKERVEISQIDISFAMKLTVVYGETWFGTGDSKIKELTISFGEAFTLYGVVAKEFLEAYPQTLDGWEQVAKLYEKETGDDLPVRMFRILEQGVKTTKDVYTLSEESMESITPQEGVENEPEGNQTIAGSKSLLN